MMGGMENLNPNESTGGKPAFIPKIDTKNLDLDLSRGSEVEAPDDVVERLQTRDLALRVAESKFPVGSVVTYFRDSESNQDLTAKMVKEEWEVVGHKLDGESDKTFVVIGREGRENRKVPIEDLETMNHLLVIDRKKRTLN